MIPFEMALVADLGALAEIVITDVLDNGGRHTGRPTDEVAAVETMTRDGFEEIAARWTTPLRKKGYKIDLKAVFLHSRPQVVWPRPGRKGGRCELADLLVVMDHKGPGSLRADRRAILIQAKVLKRGRIRLTKASERVQFELLSEWPIFTFHTGGYDARARDFHHASAPGEASSSGEYGGVELVANPRTWVQEMVAPPNRFHSGIPFGSLLAGMACGVDMHGREAVSPLNDDWSFTVDELLRVTSLIPITKASGVPRGVTHSAGFVAMISGGGGAGGGDPPLAEGGPAPEGGPISTVHLVFTHEDHRERVPR